MLDASNRLQKRELLIQMGPSHPALHCTANVSLQMAGETVATAHLEIGHHHRGIEKMCEQSTYDQCFPYADRLNCLSPAIGSVGLALTVEKLLGLTVPERTQYIRTIIAEIARVQEHLSFLAAISHALGSLPAMRMAVEARESYSALFQELTGARVTLSYARVGGVRFDLPDGFAERFASCAIRTEQQVTAIAGMLQSDVLFAQRMCGVGVMPRDLAVNYGFTGPCLRASGIDYDIRKDIPYLIYDRLDFAVPVGENGDNFDRYLVRLEEIRQSISIVRQCLRQIPQGAICAADWRVVRPPRADVLGTMEGLIAQYELTIDGPLVPRGEVYGSVEGGNGELGFYLVSDGSGRPYRLHVRSPGLALLQGLPQMLQGCGFADIVVTFASLNAVGSEIDR